MSSTFETQIKLVSRSSLRSSISRSPSPSLTTPLKLDLEYTTPATTISHDAEDEDAETDLEMDFQLFAGTKTRITLKEPTPPPADEDIWDSFAKSQKRGMSHWVLSSEDMARRKKTLEEVLVTGEQILGMASRLPASEAARCEWKVIHIEGERVAAKKKPGKKRRIYLRIKKEKERIKEEARKKAQEGRDKFKGLTEEEKAELEKQEKIRKNREKKLKQRQREKEKKAAAAAAAAAAGGAMEIDQKKE